MAQSKPCSLVQLFQPERRNYQLNFDIDTVPTAAATTPVIQTFVTIAVPASTTPPDLATYDDRVSALIIFPDQLNLIFFIQSVSDHLEWLTIEHFTTLSSS